MADEKENGIEDVEQEDLMLKNTFKFKTLEVHLNF
jgi:hypothetical protein